MEVSGCDGNESGRGHVAPAASRIESRWRASGGLPERRALRLPVGPLLAEPPVRHDGGKHGQEQNPRDYGNALDRDDFHNDSPPSEAPAPLLTESSARSPPPITLEPKAPRYRDRCHTPGRPVRKRSAPGLSAGPAG